MAKHAHCAPVTATFDFPFHDRVRPALRTPQQPRASASALPCQSLFFEPKKPAHKPSCPLSPEQRTTHQTAQKPTATSGNNLLTPHLGGPSTHAPTHPLVLVYRVPSGEMAGKRVDASDSEGDPPLLSRGMGGVHRTQLKKKEIKYLKIKEIFLFFLFSFFSLSLPLCFPGTAANS